MSTLFSFVTHVSTSTGQFGHICTAEDSKFNQNSIIRIFQLNSPLEEEQASHDYELYVKVTNVSFKRGEPECPNNATVQLFNSSEGRSHYL